MVARCLCEWAMELISAGTRMSIVFLWSCICEIVNKESGLESLYVLLYLIIDVQCQPSIIVSVSSN